VEPWARTALADDQVAVPWAAVERPDGRALASAEAAETAGL